MPSCSPSLKRTPLTTWANSACPFNVRQFCSAVLVNLKTIARMPARETQPRVLVVRKRTVAKVDSIGIVVRMCSQCSAGYVLQNISPRAFAYVRRRFH